jgi:ElaB/YqjD/DUF883 family membrane-anchored ribosome-binding protein
MTTSSEATGQPEDMSDQIARLRAQVEALLKDHVTPAVAELAGRAEHASETIREQADVLAGYVKERPITSILIAGAIGWIVGRAMR